MWAKTTLVFGLNFSTCLPRSFLEEGSRKSYKVLGKGLEEDLAQVWICPLNVRKCSISERNTGFPADAKNALGDEDMREQSSS